MFRRDLRKKDLSKKFTQLGYGPETSGGHKTLETLKKQYAAPLRMSTLPL